MEKMCRRISMLFVWEKCPPHAFCMGEVSSACFLYGRSVLRMLFVWEKCPPLAFLYGRSVLPMLFVWEKCPPPYALCMGEVSSAMLCVWEKCPPPCSLYGRSKCPPPCFSAAPEDESTLESTT